MNFRLGTVFFQKVLINKVDVSNLLDVFLKICIVLYINTALYGHIGYITRHVNNIGRKGKNNFGIINFFHISI